jgi:ferric-dicitrate binding protein FerR (iron transport regulator)
MNKRATQAGGIYPTTQIPSPDASDGAIRWLLRLRAGLRRGAQRAAFKRWLQQSTEHAQALEEVLWIWHMLGSRAVLDAVMPKPSASGAHETRSDDG